MRSRKFKRSTWRLVEYFDNMHDQNELEAVVQMRPYWWWPFWTDVSYCYGSEALEGKDEHS